MPGRRNINSTHMDAEIAETATRLRRFKRSTIKIIGGFTSRRQLPPRDKSVHTSLNVKCIKQQSNKPFSFRYRLLPVGKSTDEKYFAQKCRSWKATGNSLLTAKNSDSCHCLCTIFPDMNTPTACVEMTHGEFHREVTRKAHSY